MLLKPGVASLPLVAAVSRTRCPPCQKAVVGKLRWAWSWGRKGFRRATDPQGKWGSLPHDFWVAPTSPTHSLSPTILFPAARVLHTPGPRGPVWMLEGCHRSGSTDHARPMAQHHARVVSFKPLNSSVRYRSLFPVYRCENRNPKRPCHCFKPQVANADARSRICSSQLCYSTFWPTRLLGSNSQSRCGRPGPQHGASSALSSVAAEARTLRLGNPGVPPGQL